MQDLGPGDPRPTAQNYAGWLQEWVRAEGARLIVVFEGRDAAGKGSTIKRVSEYHIPEAPW